MFESEGRVTRAQLTGAYRDKPAWRRGGQRHLFLDELGEMSCVLQAILLRLWRAGKFSAWDRHRIDGRVKCRIRRRHQPQPDGTHRRRRGFAKTCIRLNVIRLNDAPLRERGADVDILLQHTAETSKTHRVVAPRLAAERKRCDLIPLARQCARGRTRRTAWSGAPTAAEITPGICVGDSEAFTFAPQNTAKRVQTSAKSRVETCGIGMGTKGEDSGPSSIRDFIDRGHQDGSGS